MALRNFTLLTLWASVYALVKIIQICHKVFRHQRDQQLYIHLALHLLCLLISSRQCRSHRRLDFFYSNKNNLVQLEDTAIKTERCCSKQCTERTRAVHHSIDFYLYFKSNIVFGVALGPLCARCSTNQCFVLFAGSEQSMCKDADIIYSSQTELAGCDEWQIRIKMECECDVIEGRSTIFAFFVLCLFYHFKWQTVKFIYFSLLHCSLC